MLSVLVFREMEHNMEITSTEGLPIENKTSSKAYVPTARFAAKVAEENKTEAARQPQQKTEKPEEKQEEEKVAYLTFDDGPSENTKSILKTLQEKNAVATFFLVGSEITPEREEIVKQEIKQGNAIGVHTYCHKKNQMYCNADCFFEDFQSASEVIRRVTGKTPKLHRFPWGSNNPYVSSYVDELHERLKEMGVKSYDWNVSGEDSVSVTVPQETIIRNVKKDLTKHNQAIILLHDSNSTKNTAAVLGGLIDYIRGEGYRFDTLEGCEEYMFPASWR